MKLSLVVPCYNEEENVKVFADPLCLDKIVSVVKELTSK